MAITHSHPSLLTIVGARPQFIKAAPISSALRLDGAIYEAILHTGQHHDYNLSDVFFKDLMIPEPEICLGISGGSNARMVSQMLDMIASVINERQPDAVLVYGDTNSTLAGALAAKQSGKLLIHVEAGLRSNDKTMPEEINRIVTDHLADILLCPSHAAISNLKNEGILEGVHHVGDVMFDTFCMVKGTENLYSSANEPIDLPTGDYAIATVHRAANTDNPTRMSEIFRYIRDEAGSLPVVLPIHPRTAAAAERHGIDLSWLKIIPPLSYRHMAKALSNSRIIFTDSGGVQKEAYFHRVPCITLRDNTEWTETIDSGWNRLWTRPDWNTPRREIADYGSGDAAKRIVTILHNTLLHEKTSSCAE